jgi:plastocyanin
MAAYKSFTLRMLAVFVFILFTGLTTVALAQEETTETSETDQSSISEGNEYDSQTHTIVLINNAFDPETAEINQYDTVVWRNLNKPKRSFVLVSEDNLWEDFTLGYGKSFEYTFNKTGTFGFSIEGESGLEGTVVVNESRETAGVPPLEEETQPQIQQEETEQQEEEVTPAPTEEVTPTQTEEDVQSTENSVVIRESVFYPETLELSTGETVVWKNLNKPKRSLTLVSEEGLFENLLLGYGRSFSYTFNDAGEYTFKLDEIPGTELTVTVK